MAVPPIDPLRLSREEVLRRAPFPIEVVPSVETLHAHFIAMVLGELRRTDREGRALRLTLPVGPFDYVALADASNRERVSWRHAVIYPIDEFAQRDGSAIAPDHPWSLRRHLTETLLQRLDGTLAPPPAQCRWLERTTLATIRAELAASPLDLACFGFGIDGHIAMNCPEPALSVEQFRALPARQVRLSRETITQLAMGGAGGDLEAVPPFGLTLGMREILGARALRIYLMRTWQPAVLRRAFFGAVTAAFPASLVQEHLDTRATVVHYVADAPWHETTQRP